MADAWRSREQFHCTRCRKTIEFAVLSLGRFGNIGVWRTLDAGFGAAVCPKAPKGKAKAHRPPKDAKVTPRRPE